MVCLVLRVGALLLERGVAGVSRGCFGLGARCARCVFRLLTLRAFPPDPPKPYRACARYARELPTESPWRLNYSAGNIGGRSLRPHFVPATLPIKRCLAAATPPQGSFVGSAPLARGNLSTPRRGTMPPPFGLPPLRVNHGRLSLVPLAVYCGGCRELAAATPSPLRAMPSCFGVPHRLQFTTRALITLAAARHLARCANGRRSAHSARGPLPALSVPLSGPQLPEAPPGLRPESGSRATPSVFVGSRQPPILAARAMGAAYPGCLGNYRPNQPVPARVLPLVVRCRGFGGWLRVARSQRSGAFQIDGAHTVTP